MHTFQLCDYAQKYIKVPLDIRNINRIEEKEQCGDEDIDVAEEEDSQSPLC
jgi:hypothetical protein